MKPAPGLPTDEADGLVEEARVAERAGRFEVARGRYEAALRRLRGQESAPRASALLRWIGRTHEATGDLGAATDCYEAAFAVAEAAGSTEDLAHVLNCLGILMFRRGALEEAQALYERARGLAEAAGEERLIAMVDQNLGNVANVHGDHAEAHACYLRSLERYRALGLDEYIGPLLVNVGRVHIDLEEWDEADSVFDSATRICDASGQVGFSILVHVNRTRMHLACNDLEGARRACDDAMELSLRLSDERWLGEIHMHDGVIRRSQGRPGLAEDHFGRALREAEAREDLLLEAEIRKEMAVLFQAEGRNRELLVCLQRAHDAFERLRARGDLAAVSREIRELERSFERIVSEWGDSIESTDRYTRGHCERVADYACSLAVAAGIDERDLTWFRMGALLHDVGKVDVPARILNKRGPLDDEEWAVMRRHPELGVRLLQDVEFPWDIRPMVLHHHERWDGSGYPAGLAGEEIPISARILCVADVFDALTTTRSYRQAFTTEVALEIMAGDAGHVFDPTLFELFEPIVLSTRPLRSPVTPLFRTPLPILAASRDPAPRNPPLHSVA